MPSAEDASNPTREGYYYRVYQARWVQVSATYWASRDVNQTFCRRWRPTGHTVILGETRRNHKFVELTTSWEEWGFSWELREVLQKNWSFASSRSPWYGRSRAMSFNCVETCKKEGGHCRWGWPTHIWPRVWWTIELAQPSGHCWCGNCRTWGDEWDYKMRMRVSRSGKAFLPLFRGPVIRGATTLVMPL